MALIDSENNFQYDEQTLAFLATNLGDPDVLFVFQQVFRFRERGGFLKAYLPDWNTKRRRYDNAFLVLESTKFISCLRDRSSHGPSTPYYPTIRGGQLAEYLINEWDLPKEPFVKLSDEQYEQFRKTRQLPAYEQV